MDFGSGNRVGGSVSQRSFTYLTKITDLINHCSCSNDQQVSEVFPGLSWTPPY